MAFLRSHAVMTSVFITVAAIVTTLTGIVAPKHMQTTFFIGLTLI